MTVFSRNAGRTLGLGHYCFARALANTSWLMVRVTKRRAVLIHKYKRHNARANRVTKLTIVSTGLAWWVRQLFSEVPLLNYRRV